MTTTTTTAARLHVADEQAARNRGRVAEQHVLFERLEVTFLVKIRRLNHYEELPDERA